MINALQRYMLLPQEIHDAQSNIARQKIKYNLMDQRLKIKHLIDAN